MSMPPGDDFPIGSPPDLLQLNAMLAGDAIGLASVMNGIFRRWRYISKVGAAGLQGPPWHLPKAKAEEMYEGFDRMATIARVYFGQATQPDEVDFDDALALIRGGTG